MHPYERWIIRRYLANALRSNRFVRPPSADSEIFSWINSCSRLLDLPELVSATRSLRRRLATEPPMLSARWKAWRAAVISIAREPEPHPSPLQKRLDWLAQACSLNGGQSRVLGLLARATRTPEVRRLVEAINDRFDMDGSDLQPFLDTNSERVELSARGRLSELGLIDAQDSPSLSLVVHRLLSLPRFQPRRVSDLLLGEPARASLAWKDFEHLGDLRDLAARIVGSAGGLRGTTRRGVNLLFYGPPGTGKSEFAKTLGAHLSLSVQFCGETGEENAEPNRRERIAALLIANAVGAMARRTIVVVDEADDLLFALDDDGAFGRHGSKVFMNRLLERTVAPTIWIVNDIGRLGPSIIRRMNVSLRFPKPTLSVRKSMIARIATRADLRLRDSEMLDLAQTPAPPALIENAILSAKHIRGSATDAHMILDSGLRALPPAPPRHRRVAKPGRPPRQDRPAPKMCKRPARNRISQANSPERGRAASPRSR
jgi:transitional endoplasmic reticulum ATPase